MSLLASHPGQLRQSEAAGGQPGDDSFRLRLPFDRQHEPVPEKNSMSRENYRASLKNGTYLGSTIFCRSGQANLKIWLRVSSIQNLLGEREREKMG